MSKETPSIFIRTVKNFYKTSGRHTLPWRHTHNPYRIAISEVMLQQTQVDRVIPKYRDFLKVFPTVEKLAGAKLADVLRLWSGLGYNRRAKYLYEMAKVVMNEYGGKFPKNTLELKQLPAIGSYTAGAISVFAYNNPEVFIETNIRTVYIHHFFPNKKNISDKELFPIIEHTLDHKNPREWYAALMDYGSYLKVSGIKNNFKSKHYTKQSKFAGSKRSVRGHILRVLTKGPATLAQLKKDAPKTKYKIESVIQDLTKEGLLTKNKTNYQLA